MRHDGASPARAFTLSSGQIPTRRQSLKALMDASSTQRPGVATAFTASGFRAVFCPSGRWLRGTPDARYADGSVLCGDGSSNNPSSPNAALCQPRIFALSDALWLFSLCVLFFLCLGRASSQDTSPPESNVTDSDSIGVISKGHKREKVPAKYDINHIGNRGVGNGANKYSMERERKLGQSLARDVESNSKLITDQVITQYVNRLGQRIAANSDAQVPFTIKVIESDEINAFSLPGGYLYIDTGMILAVDNEAELAGIMAHEVAHVAARHLTRAERRMAIMRYFSIPLLGALAVPMLSMKFGRDAEREADLLGLQYEYAAGYDPQAFVQFFQKLHTTEKQKQNFLEQLFATHPVTEDRIRRAQKEISSLLPEKIEYVVDTSEFQEVKARVYKLMHELPVLHRRCPWPGWKSDDSRERELMNREQTNLKKIRRDVSDVSGARLRLR